VADFMRKINQVAVPKCDRLSDGVANWKPDARKFADAPFAIDVVAACEGRGNDRKDGGYCYEKQRSHGALSFERYASREQPKMTHLCPLRIGSCVTNNAWSEAGRAAFRHNTSSHTPGGTWRISPCDPDLWCCQTRFLHPSSVD
jgi:hypothetical protein